MMDRKQEIQASYKQLGEFGSFYDNIPLWDDEKESLWMLPRVYRRDTGSRRDTDYVASDCR